MVVTSENNTIISSRKSCDTQHFRIKACGKHRQFRELDVEWKCTDSPLMLVLM